LQPIGRSGSDGLMSIVVRRVGPDEGQVLKQVRLAALGDRPDAFGSTLEREEAFTDEVWAARASQSSAGNHAVTYLAWLGDAAVGIVTGIRDSSVVDLTSMWTSPNVRRSGVGQRLVEATVEWSADAGAARVELWVTRDNDSAQRLYASLGFVVTGDHKPLPSDPCKDEIRMVRRLTAGAAS
jgi:ribosomal protein S18 acetylase RimI-like enzyme